MISVMICVLIFIVVLIGLAAFASVGREADAQFNPENCPPPRDINH